MGDGKHQQNSKTLDTLLIKFRSSHRIFFSRKISIIQTHTRRIYTTGTRTTTFVEMQVTIVVVLLMITPQLLSYKAITNQSTG